MTTNTERVNGTHVLLGVMTHDDAGSAVSRLHEQLRATADRPIEATARRRIGEAEAVAGDLVGADVDPEVLEERLGHVVDLLAAVDETGDPEADEHVAAARRIAAELLSES